MAATNNGNNNNNSVSKPSLYLQDMDEVQKVFKRFDTNGDGMISADELSGVINALGSDTSPDEVARMMDEIDTDRDGYINLDEFAEFCKGDVNGVGDGGVNELREAFDLYDQDSNGLISAAELHQILIRLGESCSVQDCTKMISSVDADGDGYVNFDEFKKMMTNSK
ncbi:calcium-binding allergen Ole e 8-like [Nicotiana tomentosiformis]|uniref:calcium-binding allergen Ole e 8-like n=1 Tax=Nicotiana tomentosiformis TaxID=4098 RepID=UPI00051ABFDF